MPYEAMLKGWKISSVRPGRGASGALRHEFILVAIADQAEALRAVKECLPDAEITVDSEASQELLAEYQVIDGEMVVLAD
ncbi:hypothetical protein [Nitrobacter sp. JJSN]|jgi:hypothetical protein|uniref:hypothetical protein n=1 Tax=Nitrobacter sp. JJSN TaxID=3453033 RepID=UPI003F75B63D